MKPREDNGSYVEVPLDSLAGRTFTARVYTGADNVVELTRDDGELVWVSARREVPLVVTMNGEND